MALVLFVLIWIISTIYLALALAICVAVLMLVYWAFTQLPTRFGSGSGSVGRPDRRADSKRRRSR